MPSPPIPEEKLVSFIHDAELVDPYSRPTKTSIIKAAHAAELALQDDVQWFGAHQIMDVYNQTKDLATHIHDKAITDTVYLDRAGRPIRHAVSEYWRHAYPKEPQPNVHFMIPNLGMPIDEGMRILWPLRNWAKRRRATRAISEAPERFRSLREEGRSILVIDGCAHSGQTFDAAELLLRKLGAQNIEMAVFDDEHTNDTRPKNINKFSELRDGCMPYGTDISLRTDDTELFATALSHPELRRNARQLRQEISRIITIGYAAEHNTKKRRWRGAAR